MSVHTILAYMKCPSQAYTIATPAHRLVVEADNFHPQGHEVAGSMRHRKVTGAFGMMTGVEVMIGYKDPEKAEKYLNACRWWLHRAPFGVERLQLTVIAHGYKEYADRDKKIVYPWDRFPSMPSVNLSNLCSTLPQIVELDISFTTVTDTTPVARLKNLEVLVAGHTSIASVEPLRHLQHLRRVNLSECKLLQSIAVREGMESLEALDVSGSGFANMGVLGKLKNLKAINVANCKSLTSLSGLAGAPALEQIHAGESGISDVDGLHQCQRLKRLTVGQCCSLRSLSGVCGAPALELIGAHFSGVSSVDGLHQCPRLRAIDVVFCKALTSLSGLAGAPALEVVVAWKSGITSVAGLDRCPKLTRLDLRGTSCEKLSRGIQRDGEETSRHETSD